MSQPVAGVRAQKLEEKKQVLIANLIAVRQRIIAAAVSLPLKKRKTIFLGIWSPMELLAHLAGWDETNLAAAELILANKLPRFYRYYDKDWATYNANLVAKYGRPTLKELVKLVRKTQETLIDFLSTLPADEYWRNRGIRARGWKVTIGSLLEAEFCDEEEHYSQLKAFADTRTGS
jgi:hypothetical protein